MKIVIVGATGMVGSVMLQVLEERNFPITSLIPVASERSIGRSIRFKSKDLIISSMQDAIAQGADDIAFFLQEEILP